VIDDLVERTGISRPYISQVETGMAIPSLPTLQKLATALDIPLAYLFIEDESPAVAMRKDEHPLVTFGEKGTDLFRKLWFLSTPGRQIEMVILEIPVGYTAGGRNHLHDGEECHYILSGEIRAVQGERVYLLKEGDSYHWDGSVPHRVENAGRKLARILIARTPPGFLTLKIYADTLKEQEHAKAENKPIRAVAARAKKR
jgi:transcriptional regulator with XRE-family HTH domain